LLSMRSVSGGKGSSGPRLSYDPNAS